MEASEGDYLNDRKKLIGEALECMSGRRRKPAAMENKMPCKMEGCCCEEVYQLDDFPDVDRKENSYLPSNYDDMPGLVPLIKVMMDHDLTHDAVLELLHFMNILDNQDYLMLVADASGNRAEFMEETLQNMGYEEGEVIEEEEQAEGKEAEGKEAEEEEKEEEEEEVVFVGKVDSYLESPVAGGEVGIAAGAAKDKVPAGAAGDADAALSGQVLDGAIGDLDGDEEAHDDASGNAEASLRGEKLEGAIGDRDEDAEARDNALGEADATLDSQAVDGAIGDLDGDEEAHDDASGNAEASLRGEKLEGAIGDRDEDPVARDNALGEADAILGLLALEGAIGVLDEDAAAPEDALGDANDSDLAADGGRYGKRLKLSKDDVKWLMS